MLHISLKCEASHSTRFCLSYIGVDAKDVQGRLNDDTHKALALK